MTIIIRILPKGRSLKLLEMLLPQTDRSKLQLSRPLPKTNQPQSTYGYLGIRTNTQNNITGLQRSKTLCKSTHNLVSFKIYSRDVLLVVLLLRRTRSNSKVLSCSFSISQCKELWKWKDLSGPDTLLLHVYFCYAFGGELWHLKDTGANPWPQISAKTLGIVLALKMEFNFQ